MKSRILILLFCLNVGVLYAQENGTWDYPVKPGMEEWNRLATEEERISVLQVPEAILAVLSPDEVVRLSITLPTFFLFTAWNTPQEGFTVMLSRYNILRHLLSCEDAGRSLIAAYKDANLSGFKRNFWLHPKKKQ